MAKGGMQTPYGEAVLFKNNPRVIREGQFNALVESVERYPEFMVAQKIVLWRVPDRVDTGEEEKCPFVGQEGKLIVLSGNQRVKALQAQGKDSIPEAWCCEAKGEDGNWWAWRDAEVFLNLANSPAGVSGDFDYVALQDKFDEFRMKIAGIDFSNFTDALVAGTMKPPVDDDGDTDEEAVEKDELMGEKSEELQEFIAEREKTRKALKEVDEAGFHLLLVFEDGFAEKAEFVSKAKVFGGTVALDRGPYLDLVFESYGQKAEFLDRSGLRDVKTEDGLPAVMFGLFCDGRAFAKRMGIELAETGIHNRGRIVDKQLSEMAIEPMVQKSEGEIETEIFERLRKEREELGMEAGKGDGGKKVGKGNRKGRGSGSVPKGEDSPRPEDETGDAVFVAEEAFEETEGEDR